MAELAKRRFDFLPLTIRVETLGGVATPLVLRGTPLPAVRSDTFSTAADNQESVEISLFIGERPLTEGNSRIGVFHLKNIPSALAGTPQIKIQFTVDKECSVTAHATLQGVAGAEERFLAPIDLTEKTISQLLSDAESTRAADEATLRRIEAVNRARGMIARAEKRIQDKKDPKLNAAIAALGLALASEDSEAIREKTDELYGVLNPLNPFTGFDSSVLSDLFGSRVPTEKQPIARKKPVSPPKEELASPHVAVAPGKIFGGGSFTLDSQLCFVLMPFDGKFQATYDGHIRPIVEKASLRCKRADEIAGTNAITWDIWENINRARFLIAELTDRNPNVFYELGLAHALSKDVILVTQLMDDVPFDLKAIRCIVYEATPDGLEKLRGRLAATIDALVKTS